MARRATQSWDLRHPVHRFKQQPYYATHIFVTFFRPWRPRSAIKNALEARRKDKERNSTLTPQQRHKFKAWKARTIASRLSKSWKFDPMLGGKRTFIPFLFCHEKRITLGLSVRTLMWRRRYQDVICELDDDYDDAIVVFIDLITALSQAWKTRTRVCLPGWQTGRPAGRQAGRQAGRLALWLRGQRLRARATETATAPVTAAARAIPRERERSTHKIW